MENKSTDIEIRARLTANDSSALEMIWERYSTDLLAYLTSLLCSRFDAEDALQEVFIAISRKRQLLAKAHHFKAYLFRLAHNTAVNRIKKSRRGKEHADKVSDWLLLSHEGEQEADRTEEVTSALESLPDDQRTVLVFKFYRDKTFSEIGELLDISANTAASRYRYGISKLRSILEEIKA